MTATKKQLSVSLDSDVADRAVDSAKGGGVSLSAWLNAAAEQALLVEDRRAATYERAKARGAPPGERLAFAESIFDFLPKRTCY